MRYFFLFIFISLHLGSFACIYDSDTVESEISRQKRLQKIEDKQQAEKARKKQRRDFILKAIGGTTYHYPALYYEMRIAELEKKLKAKPSDLILYDDIATAYERLGNHDSAIEWIDRKHEILISFAWAYEQAELDEQWYRFYANKGTYHAHRWFRSGANHNQPEDLNIAIEYVEKSIQLFSGAHMGREEYQLKFLRWVRDKETRTNPLLLPDFLALDQDFQTDWKQETDNDAVMGITGMITLGAGSESIDLFNSLTRLFERRDQEIFAGLSELRLEEIRNSGRSSIVDHGHQEKCTDGENCSHLGILNSSLSKDSSIHNKFNILRKYSDEYQAKRTEFMMSKLNAGIHPDTHKDFWEGWKEPIMPDFGIEERSLEEVISQALNNILLPIASVLFMIMIFFMIFGRTKKNARIKSSA